MLRGEVFHLYDVISGAVAGTPDAADPHRPSVGGLPQQPLEQRRPCLLVVVVEGLGRAPTDCQDPILIPLGTPLPPTNTLGVDRVAGGPFDTVNDARVRVEDRLAVRKQHLVAG